ncbi:hypothetical protein PR202_gb09084 [Eleusine coracana subsp. coracana]|uniref:Serine/threonine-protein phosphatase 2A 55 kDa regulatory subunit B n=1 Tax=Eleusine coracana subsp. coracana TaxID=191504 RepID=A0AAV5EEN9_ELECO|nr:hypothetical protein PR202_gb09084 [Eleusine coracana subsp. coracana]
MKSRLSSSTAAASTWPLVTTPAVSSSSDGPTRTMYESCVSSFIQTRLRSELERTDHAGAPPPRYGFAMEFQSHEMEVKSLIELYPLVQFDALHSLEICEKIKKLRWCARPNSALLMLATNDRTVKLWKGRFPNTSRRKGTIGRDGPLLRCLQIQSTALQREVMQGMGTLPSVGRSSAVVTGTTSTPFRTTGNLLILLLKHETFPGLGKRDTNCCCSDGETFVSADDLWINLWHLEVTNQCFNIVDMKPAVMEDLVEVITAAEFHPSSCSTLAYGSSSGVVRLVDLRRSALCDQSARIFRDRENRLQQKTFFTEIVSCITDLKFTGDGKYLLTRDFLNLKLWDLRKESSPVVTYKVHEFLRPKLSDLYTDDHIFDRFSCCASNDGTYFATGSYRTQTYRPSKGSGLLNNLLAETTEKGLIVFAGQDGLRPAGNKDEIPCNMASKVTHIAWHPTEDFIVCAAKNSLYMYHM